MKIPSAIQQGVIDKRTMELESISSLDLMERAGFQLFQTCCSFLTKNDVVSIVCGTGNNGGDGLVLARYLAEVGYMVTVVLPTWEERHSPEFSANLQRLKTTSVGIQRIQSAQEIVPLLEKVQWVIEALFGTGLSRPLEGEWSSLVQRLNELKVRRCAIDIPAGLFADQDTPITNTVFKAERTLAIHAPKKCFFSMESAAFVGNWDVVDIDISAKAIAEQTICETLNTQERMSGLYRPRNKHSYKQQLGHAYLLAGSSETAGAALLSAVACMRSGVGLLTACVEPSITSALNTYIPEVMTSNQIETSFGHIQAIGVGPGWGREKRRVDTLRKLLDNSKGIPKVVDADGIYALRSLIDENLDIILSDLVLTPHKGEFKHLTKTHPKTDMEYWKIQRAFCQKHQCIILLKGAYTSIVTPEGHMYFNATGNPGMATAGSGDVLTGLLLGLLAQGYELDSAASLATFLHGMSGDLAVDNSSFESLIASDIVAYFGAAFKTLNDHGSSNNS